MARSIKLPTRRMGLAWRLAAALTLLLALLPASLLGTTPGVGAAGPTTTLTFDEVPFQPVDGLTVSGVTFNFAIGFPSLDAFYHATGPGMITNVQDPSLEGNAAGALTLTFDTPTATLEFGLARSCECTLSPGVAIALTGPADAPIGTFIIDTAPISSTFSEGKYKYSGTPVAQAVITFPNSGAAPRFALDNLTYDTPPLLTSGSAAFGDATATLTATVTSAGAPVPAGGAVTFTFDEQDYPATTNASGVATATVPLPPDKLPGTYPDAVQASYAGDSGIPPAEASGPLVITPPDCSALFVDVYNFDLACPAIYALATAGIIQGFDTTPPTFGPYFAVQRAQIAAFVVRALEWENQPTGPRDFDDIGALPGDLATAALILANRCANPANDATCVAQGYGDGRFGPNDYVSHAQVISFIARAFALSEVYDWEPQPNQAIPYFGVPSDHLADVRIYHHYAGTIPNAPTFDLYWNAPASRAWVARVLWQAIVSAP